MNSRPLLDYLTDPIDEEPRQPQRIDPAGTVSALQARLRELEAHLNARPSQPRTERPVAQQAAVEPDLTLSSQIEAILSRKTAIQAPVRTTYEEVPRQPQQQEPMRVPRVVVEPPPIVTAQAEEPRSVVDADFLKFTEAVYLIGQAAKRFIEQPQPSHIQPAAPVAIQHAPAPQAPSTLEIDALSAMLRETVTAFRNVADDLAVSAGEFRKQATREPAPTPIPAPAPVRYTSRRPDAVEDEIAELRDTMDELQDRLDGLMRGRRRHARY